MEDKKYIFVCNVYQMIGSDGRFQQSTEIQLIGDDPKEIEKRARSLFPDRKEFWIRTVIEISDDTRSSCCKKIS